MNNKKEIVKFVKIADIVKREPTWLEKALAEQNKNFIRRVGSGLITIAAIVLMTGVFTPPTVVSAQAFDENGVALTAPISATHGAAWYDSHKLVGAIYPKQKAKTDTKKPDQIPAIAVKNVIKKKAEVVQSKPLTSLKSWSEADYDTRQREIDLEIARWDDLIAKNNQRLVASITPDQITVKHRLIGLFMGKDPRAVVAAELLK